MTVTKTLATVTKTEIEIEDHGLLTCWVHLRYESGNCQAAGGYNLDAEGEAHRFLRGIMETFQVRSWADLSGKTGWAFFDAEGLSAPVIGLAGFGASPFFFRNVDLTEGVKVI